MPTLTPSETVYFHPARFAREKKLIDAAGLPHSEQKFDGSELATAILAAALLGAEQAGALKLDVGKTGRLFGLRKVDAVLVSRGPTPDAFPADSMEGRAIAAVAARTLDAEAVVEAMLVEDAADPHAWAVALVTRDLARRGLYQMEEARTLKVFRSQKVVVPDATRALAASTPPQPVRDLLDRTQRERAHVWRLLQDGIKRGVSDRTEHDRSEGPDAPD